MKQVVFYLLIFAGLSSGILQAQPESDTRAGGEHMEESILESSSTAADSSDQDSSTLRTIPLVDWEKMTSDKAFQYQRQAAKKPKPPRQPIFPDLGRVFNALFFKILLFLAVAFILGAVIYHFYFSGERPRLWKKRKKQEPEPEAYEELETFDDWETVIRSAIEKEDYRLAIRLLYLQTLKRLQERSLINYQREKTNWDYVLQLSSTSYGDRFTTLTKYFDYIWYGNFRVDRSGFEEIRNHYITFQQHIV